MDKQFFASAALLAALLASGAGGAPDEAETRRKRIAGMAVVEKQHLLRSHQRFAALPPEQQQHLRQLEADLQSDKEGPKLRQVMRRYHEWFERLSTDQRGELLTKSPADRLEAIKRIRQDERNGLAEALDEGWPITPEDCDKIVGWLENVVLSRRDEFWRKQGSKEGLAKDDDKQRAQKLAMAWQRGRFAAFAPGQGKSREALRELISQLSPGVRERIDSVPPEQRPREVSELVQLVMRRHLKSMGLHMPLAANEQELERFFTVELPADQREKLLDLSADEMQRELRKRYQERRPDGRRPPGMRPGRGNRPGFGP